MANSIGVLRGVTYNITQVNKRNFGNSNSKSLTNKFSINGVGLYIQKHSSLKQIARAINSYENRTHVKALVTKYGKQERMILVSKSRAINIVDSNKVLFNLHKNGLISTVSFNKASNRCIINYGMWPGTHLSKSLLSDSTIYLLSGSARRTSEEEDRMMQIEAYERDAIVRRMDELEDDDAYSSDEEDRMMQIEAYERDAIVRRMDELEDDDAYSSDEEDRMMQIEAYERDAIVRRAIA